LDEPLTSDEKGVYFFYTLKQCFDKEAISMLFPQRDVHTIPATVEDAA